MLRKITLTALALMASVAALTAQPKVVAHRGYWNIEGSAQNSLASFTNADAIKAFGSEIDVWFTGDGHLVVNHDRMHGGLDMTKATLKQIKELRLPNGEEIPTIDQYLQHVVKMPNTRLIFEMKSNPDLNREDMAVKLAIKKLEEYDLLDRTDIIAFSINTCLEFKKLLPDTKIMYLDGDFTPSKIKDLGLAGIDYSTTTLRQHPQWVAQAHELGLEVNVWTVNSVEDMNYFIELGVDYITTDNPEQLQAIIKNR